MWDSGIRLRAFRHMISESRLARLLHCALKGKRQVFLEAKSEQLNYLSVSEVHSGGSSFALLSPLRTYSYNLYV